jgi:hypothetical protein
MSWLLEASEQQEAAGGSNLISVGGEAASSSENEDVVLNIDDPASSTPAELSKPKQRPSKKKEPLLSLAERASKAAESKKLASLRFGTAKNLIVPHLLPSATEMSAAIAKARATCANSSIAPLLQEVVARLAEGFSDDESALFEHVRRCLIAAGATEIEIADIATVVSQCCERKVYCDCSLDSSNLTLSGWEVVDKSIFGFAGSDVRPSCVESLRKLRRTVGEFVQNLVLKHEHLISQDFNSGALKNCEKELSRLEKKRDSEQKQWDSAIQKVVDKFQKEEESKVAAAAKASAKAATGASKPSGSKPAPSNAVAAGSNLFSVVVISDDAQTDDAVPAAKMPNSTAEKETRATGSTPKVQPKANAKAAPPAPPSKSIAMFFKKVDKPAEIELPPPPCALKRVSSNETAKSPVVPLPTEASSPAIVVAAKPRARLSRFMPWNTPNFTIMAPHPYGPFEGSVKRVACDAIAPGDISSWVQVFKACKVVRALPPVTVEQDESGEPGGVTLRKRLIHHASVMVDGGWFSAIRPAYYGVVLRSAPCVTARTPFAQDKSLDYDYNSEDEWSDEEDGETINSCDEDEEVDEDDDMDDGFVDDEFDAGKNLPTAKLVPQVMIFSESQVDASLSASFAELCAEWFDTDPLECDALQDEDDETAGSKRSIAKVVYRKEWDAPALLQLVAVIHNSQSRDDFVEKFQALIPDFAKASIQGKINEMQGAGIVSRHKPGPEYRKVWRVAVEWVQKAVESGHTLIPDSECLCKKAEKNNPHTPDGDSGKRGREGEDDALSSKRTAPHVTLEQCFNRPEGSEPMLSVKPQILQEHLEKEERESNEKVEKYRECEAACQRFIEFWSRSSEKTFENDLGDFVSLESNCFPKDSECSWKHFTSLLDAVVYCVCDFSFFQCEPAEKELSLKSGKALACFMHALTVAAAVRPDSERYADLASHVQASQKSLGEALRKRSFRSLFLKNLENKGAKMASYRHRLYVCRIATFVHCVGFDLVQLRDSTMPLDDSLKAARDHMRRDFAAEATLKLVYDSCYDGSLGTWVQAFDSKTGLMNSLLPSLLVCLSTVPVDPKLASGSALTQIALLACECTMVKAVLKRPSIFTCVEALLGVIFNRYTLSEKELVKLLKSTSLNILLERCRTELVLLDAEKEKVARARQLVLDRQELLVETREIDAQDKLCNWYQAFLVSQCALTCTVHFVGWESKFDETLPVHDMKHRIRERTSTAAIGKLGQEERPAVQPRTYENVVLKDAKEAAKESGDPLCCFDRAASASSPAEIAAPVAFKCCLNMMIQLLGKNSSIQRKGGLFWSSQDTTFLSEILRLFAKVLPCGVADVEELALKGLDALPDMASAPTPLPKVFSSCVSVWLCNHQHSPCLQVLKAMQADQLIKGEELNFVRRRRWFAAGTVFHDSRL